MMALEPGFILSEAMGGTAAISLGLLGCQIAAAEVLDTKETIWHRIIGHLTGMRNVGFRRFFQIVIAVKIVFLFALETSPLANWNSGILFCTGWHIYCMVASELIVIFTTKKQMASLLAIPCRRLFIFGILNATLFLIYFFVVTGLHPDRRRMGNDELPIGIIIQTYPFPPGGMLAAIWATLCGLIRISMTLVWSSGLYLLTSRIFGILSQPDPHHYQPQLPRPPHMVYNAGGGSSSSSNDRGGILPTTRSSETAVLSATLGTTTSPVVDNHPLQASGLVHTRRSGDSGGDLRERRRMSAQALSDTFRLQVASSDLKYRFRHFAHVMEEVKQANVEVHWLATWIFLGQTALGVLAMNCLVFAGATSSFITFYIVIMICYVLYTMYAFSSLVAMITLMRFNFLSVIDKDLLSLDLDTQMEHMRDNLQIRQVVLEMQPGISILQGSVTVDMALLFRMFGLLASIFFVLVNMKARRAGG